VGRLGKMWGWDANEGYARWYATQPVARALVMASGMPKEAPVMRTLCHCFAASGAGASMMAGTDMKERLAFWP
jgi:hypothetical protein